VVRCRLPATEPLGLERRRIAMSREQLHETSEALQECVWPAPLPADHRSRCPKAAKSQAKRNQRLAPTPRRQLTAPVTGKPTEIDRRIGGKGLDGLPYRR